MDNQFNSEIVLNKRLLPGIHGLRGIAALAVVLYHLKHIVGIAPSNYYDFIGRDFGFSVHLFFIVSAFSLCYSTQPKINDINWLPSYFIKRFFRIAPMYYFIIVFEVVRHIIMRGSIATDINKIFLDLAFVSGFIPARNFVMGGWSVGVEMIFYATFPVLLLTIRTHRSALYLLIIAIVISSLIRSTLNEQYLQPTPKIKWDWSYYAFAANFCFFAMGIYAFHASLRYEKSNIATKVIPFLALMLIASLMFFDVGTYLYGNSRWDITVWGLGFTMLCIWQSVSPSLFIANWIFEFLGERSFSVYLLHPIIIHISKGHLLKIYEFFQTYIGLNAFFVCAVFLIVLILLIAELTYRFIEIPGITFGRKLTIS